MLAETVCSAVSAAGLGIAAVTAYRKRFLAATRIAAYALVPFGLVLTGLVEWVAGIAFKPDVWAGFALLALSWLLFMTTRTVERRRGGTREERKAAKAAARGDALAPGASAPALGGTRQPPAAQPKTRSAAQPKGQSKDAGAGEDFSDIEAILKKHGL
ncbi:hypothetical protein [Streptomyces hypolithicus]